LTSPLLTFGFLLAAIVISATAPTQKVRWIAVETIVGKTVIVKADGGTVVAKMPKDQARIGDCSMPGRVRAADGRCYLKSRLP